MAAAPAARRPRPVRPECPHAVRDGAAGRADGRRGVSGRVAGRAAPGLAASLVLARRSGRDLRGASGRAAALAQVLATGEPTRRAHVLDRAVLLEDLRAVLPLADFARAGLQCVGRRMRAQARRARRRRGVTIVEWDVAAEPAGCLSETHPSWSPSIRPIAGEHVELRAADWPARACSVHLYYGDESVRPRRDCSSTWCIPASPWSASTGRLQTSGARAAARRRAPGGRVGMAGGPGRPRRGDAGPGG